MAFHTEWTSKRKPLDTQIPVVGVGFQTSTFAAVVLMVYTARHFKFHEGSESD
jgi:hypothetical protein